MTENYLPPDFHDRLQEIGTAKILIGIPTYNNARTVRDVLKSVIGGLEKIFPGTHAVIINCDGGSQDGTPEAFTQEHMGRGTLEVLSVHHSVPTVRPIAPPEHGVPGYENALRVLFYAAEQLGVEACAVVNGNLRSVTSEWVGLILSPITERSFDFVAPLYRRHKFDGSLTNSIIYPLNRALYGKKVRFHGGGGYGVSGKLASFCLTKDVWEGELAKWEIISWLTTVSIAEGYEVCHASLGPRIQDTTVSASDLSATLSHAVGSVFSLMEAYETVWESRDGSSPVPMFGPTYQLGMEPIQVNVGRMVRAFRQGLRDLLPLWEIILSSETMAQVLPLGLLEVEDFRFSHNIWVQVIYDFAIAYHETVIHREHLLKALTPLYLGRTASFILEIGEGGAEEVEQNIEQLCLEFEIQKFSLRERWR